MTGQNETRRRAKGRWTLGPFLRLPRDLMEHEAFCTLSPRATKFLIDIACNYNGHNNGDLSATFRQMKARGWNSSDQMHKAKKELLDRGLILMARQGGLNKSNLYALTWFLINECDGKLDISPTVKPPNYWKRWSASGNGLNRQ